MAIFLLSGVVLFGCFLANVLLLQRLASLFSRHLWQVAPPEMLRDTAAGVDHFLAAIITAAVFSLQWREHPTTAIVSGLLIYLLLLCGGVVRQLLQTRRQLDRCEAPQFDLRDDRLCLHHTERPSGKLYCRLHETRKAAHEPYPRPFTSVRVELYAPTVGLVAYNTYYDRLHAAKMLDQLRENGAACDFDRALVGRSAQGDILGVRLSPNWIPLLCGPLKELPPQTRAWWRQLLDSTEPAQEIQDPGFLRLLRPLLLAAEHENLAQTSFTAEFNGLKQLLETAEGQLQSIAGDKLASLIPAGYVPQLADDTSALICWQPEQKEA